LTKTFFDNNDNCRLAKISVGGITTVELTVIGSWFSLHQYRPTVQLSVARCLTNHTQVCPCTRVPLHDPRVLVACHLHDADGCSY